MNEDIEIFILEDDHDHRKLIEEKLIEKGLHPHFLYSQSSEVLTVLKGKPSVLALDFYLDGENLIDNAIIKKIKEVCKDCYTIIMSGQDSKKNFIQLIKAKADDYVEKTTSPQWLDELANAIEEGRKEVKERAHAVLERRQIEEDLENVRHRLNERMKKRQHSD